MRARDNVGRAEERNGREGKLCQYAPGTTRRRSTEGCLIIERRRSTERRGETHVHMHMRMHMHMHTHTHVYMHTRTRTHTDKASKLVGIG